MRGGENTPKIAKYRSADVIEPYILTCNHADANLKTVSVVCFKIILLYII